MHEESKKKVKSKKIIILLSISVCLTACGKMNASEAAVQKQTIQDTVQSTQESSQVEVQALEEQTEEEHSEEKKEEPGYTKIENPGFEYFIEQGKEIANSTHKVSLNQESKEKNDIIDEEKWFTDNSLAKPEFPYSDENYQYETSGDNAYDTYLLTLSDIETGKTIVTLDFSNYRYGTKYVKEDYDFISQRIIYAKAKDGVLYVATGHNTYSASCAQTAYITAIDLSDYHVIWKTEPLTCNSYSFDFVDDFIICGYGFTDEDDSLKVVDRNTGKVQSDIPVISMPEYIIYQNGKLYVRTYDTNYVYSVAISE